MADFCKDARGSEGREDECEWKWRKERRMLEQKRETEGRGDMKNTKILYV